MDRLLIAGGGTGGHLFPGVAVAEEMRRRNPSLQVLFVGTGRPVEAEVLNPRGMELTAISATGFQGKSLTARVKSLAVLPVGLGQAASVLRRFAPDMVLGVGGYVSGPVGLAARLLGITSAIQEQNSIPGVANRILGRIVDLVFIGFESAKSFFPEKKTHFTGNPIRREIAEAVGREKPRSDTFTLLVFGGSQGARAVNQAAGRAVVQLAGQGMNFKVIHQTGAADLEEVRALYADLPIQTEVEAFIGDMERVYLQADLAVCRAGALTVAETAVMGLPAIYIPLPFAAHNHQEINARSMSEAGAAEVVPQSEATPEVLAEKIGYYLRSDRVINRMRQAALSRAKPEAAEAICDICEARAAGGRKKKAGG